MGLFYLAAAASLAIVIGGCAPALADRRTKDARVAPTFKSPIYLRELGASIRSSTPRPEKGRIIYIGVYGGTPPPPEESAWFDPARTAAYGNVDIANERELNDIAFHQSVLDVVGLVVGRRFPNSVTLLLSADSDILFAVVEHLYATGDKIYLVGHSFGGAVVGQTAWTLKERNIRVEMTALIEGFWSDRIVPSNVTRALNFYVPNRVSLCPGQKKIEAQDPRLTEVFNLPIPEPKGPDIGPCAEHRNIENDPRVWKTIFDHIAESAAP
jgi:hypothetical protein